MTTRQPPHRWNHLRALMLDWAGTVVDFGSCAPVAAFIATLARHQIQVTTAQAREPMGKAKREHIAAILAMEPIMEQWRHRYQRDSNEADIDRIYVDFQTIQFEGLARHSHVIPGAAAAVAICKAEGLKVGSSTGYTRAMMQVVMAQAKHEGYEADAMVCADDVAFGRPAPWLIFEAMRRLNVYPSAAVVTVDDTVVGVEAGRNAGTWSIGLALTGNELGLSEQEVAKLRADELTRLLAKARQRLEAAGAHAVIDSIAQLPALLDEIDQRMERGERP